MTCRYVATVFVYLCCTFLAAGQVDLSEWTCHKVAREYSGSSQIPLSNHIHGYDIDQHGLIWMSTVLGVYTFDGAKMHAEPAFLVEDIQKYTVGGRYIHCDHSDRVWLIADHRGIIMYDRIQQNYLKLNTSKQADITLSNLEVSDISVENDTSVWVSTADLVLSHINPRTKSISFFDAKPVIQRFFPNAFKGRFGSIAISDEMVWIASPWGLVTFNSLTEAFDFIPYPVETDYSDPPKFNIPLFHHEKYLFIAPQFGSYSGIVVYDKDLAKYVEHFTEPSSVIHGDIFTSINLYDEHSIIAGSRRDGFVVIDIPTLKSKRYHLSAFDLQIGQAIDIFGIHPVTNDKCFVLAGDDLYEMKRKKNLFNYFSLNTSSKAKHNWQRSILELPESESFLIGTYFGDGLLQINMDSSSVYPIRYYSRKGSLDYDITIYDICLAPNDSIYLATSVGLLIFDRQNETITKPSQKALLSEQIQGTPILELISVDKQQIFISTEFNGLFSYNLETLDLQFINNSVNNYTIYDVFLSNDNTYYVTTDDGLRLYNAKNNSLEIPTLPSHHELANLSLRYSISVEGMVYLASDGNGIYRLSFEDGHITSVKNIRNAENALYNAISKFIYTPEKEGLWMNTADGFSFYHLPSSTFSNFSINEGIGFRRRNGRLFHQLRNKYIIAGAHTAFQYFHPDSVVVKLTDPIPYLKSASDHQRTYALHTFVRDTLHLPKNNKTLRIELNSINRNDNTLTYYSYKLKNYDQQWSEPSSQSSAAYTQLPGGTYTFEYRVANKNKAWIDGIPLIVIIQKKLYEYIWFKLFLLTTVFAIVYFLYKRRIQHLEKQTKIREAFNEKINELELNALRLQMNPHFVFNTINSINWFIIKNDSVHASNYLTQFSHLIRLSLDFSKHKLIPLRKELEALRIYIELEQLRFEQSFQYTITVDGHLNTSAFFVPPLIIQPFVENAIWHGLTHKSSKGKLQVTIREQSNSIVCVIEDDGIGREASQTIKSQKKIHKKSHGLEITRERLQIMEKLYNVKASYDIQDLYNESGHSVGTRVIITIPQIK